jgi:hypothetical protein
MKRLIAVPILFALGTGVAWAFWSASSGPGGNGASAATTVNQGASPTASATGNAVTVSWAASTLSNGDTVDGYVVKRYDVATVTLQTILSACTGTVAATTCIENAPAGQWKYSVTPVFATNWSGAESAMSNSVTIVAGETTPPVNAISRSLVTGGAVKSGNTIFYRGAAAGSITLINALSDSGTGPASSVTAGLTGTTTGWTHSPSTVAAPSGGPYVSNLFSWTAGTTSSPGEVVTGHDVAGNTAATTLSFVNDSTAPTAGTVSYATGYQTGLSVAVTFTTGTDSGSGLGAPNLQRSFAPLTAGSCGTYSAFANLGQASPTSPYTDSSVTNGLCYKYRYVVPDLVGNQDIATSANVAMVDYAGAVNTTTGLLSQWRLGEGAASLISADSFNDTSGDLLTTSHTGEIGATWTYDAGSADTERISNANRARRNLDGYTVNYTSGVPPTPDYSVEADLFVVSNLTGDMTGVIGRRTGTNTFYTARWEQGNLRWGIAVITGGTVTTLATTAAPAGLTVGATYRLRLSMVGTALKLYVNGVLTVSATDGSLATAGRAGIRDGLSGGTQSKTDTAGLHYDNFQVTPSTYPRAADSKGSNTGDHVNGVTLGGTGAQAGDSNTAGQFDGVNDYVQAVSTTSIPIGASSRSVELWFKTSSAARQVLFNYGTPATNQEFGLWLNAGGTTMTAWGSSSDKTFTMPGATAVNDGAWHHVVKTYDGTSIALYIDGVGLTPQTATRNTVMDAYGFGIGAVISPMDTTNSGGYFNGSLDEVSFYTTALNQATVTSHYQLGTSPAPDVTGPTGGSVAASGLVGTGSLYSTSTVLSLNLAKGTDVSGVATTGAQLLRATATLTSNGTANGSCGSYGSYTLVSDGTDPVSPKSDTVADQACYSYHYVVADLVGNSATYASADIKVDLTAPAEPALSFSTFTNTYWAGSGSTIYYRSAAASGSFRSTATATDSHSGITGYAFPALGSNWTSTPVSTGVNTYSWSGPPAAPGTKNITAANNAAGTSAGAPFTPTADDTAPSAGTVSYLNGTTSTESVSVTFTTGTDGASGIGSRFLQRASATLTGSACGTFGVFSTVATNPTSPFSDSAPGGLCYMYQYVVSDNVGNQDTATSASVAKITDITGPTGGSVGASGLVGTGPSYAASTTLSLTLVKGTDVSGVAPTGAQLLRATATLTSDGTADGSCGSFGTYTLVTGGTDPASPKSDTVADQACYSYQYVVADTLANPTTYTSPPIKVDVTAPAAPTLVFSGFSNTYWSGTGSVVFYRSAAATGSFTTTASATDTKSGIASYPFPTLGANWTSTPGALGMNTYSWSGAPAAPGTKNVIATNNATGTSATSPFTLTDDITAPTAGTLPYASATITTTAFSVTFTTGSDSGSGVGTRLLQRASATLTGGTTCGTFGAYATVTNGTNPTSPLVDTVFGGTCYKYQYVVSDNVGNPTTVTSANVVKNDASYLTTIMATLGLHNFWRLGEANGYSYGFSESSGDELADKGSWDRIGSISAVYASNRIRKSGTNLGALYAAPNSPASANYTVEADVYVASNLTNDVAGIAGRLDPAISTGTFYGAVYDQPSTTWILYSKVAGTKSVLGQSAAQPLTDSATYRLALDMQGSTIRLLVDGVQQVSVVNSAITATGKAGIVLGFGVANTTQSSSEGMHLDNFLVTPAMADSKGTNHGAYFGPSLGATGAIAGDSNDAAQFDGVNDFSMIARQISDDFSIELWFKSTQGLGVNNTTWTQGAGLVDADVSGSANDFGVSLGSDGKVVAGVGTPDVSIVSSGGFDNGTWHHVVFTRTMTSGALQLYVDGASAGTATGSTASLTSSANLEFGRLATGTNYFSGTLDEVAVYTTVLSGPTVKSHYDAGK